MVGRERRVSFCRLEGRRGWHVCRPLGCNSSSNMLQSQEFSSILLQNELHLLKLALVLRNMFDSVKHESFINVGKDILRHHDFRRTSCGRGDRKEKTEVMKSSCG